MRRDLRDAVLKANCPNPAADIREQLNLSDEEDGGVPRDQSAARKRRAPGSKSGVPLFVEVLLGEVKVKVLNKLRPLRVQCATSAVSAVVSYCQDHVAAGQGTLRKNLAAKNTGRLCPSHGGLAPASQ